MTRRTGRAVHGINLLDEKEAKPKDTDCPLMRPGGKKGPNYWIEMCKYRNTLPQLVDTCYPYCKKKEFTPSKTGKIFTNISTDHDHKAWLKMVKDGERVDTIARKYNVSVSTVSRWIKKVNQGNPLQRRKKYSVTDYACWLVDIKKGMTVTDIAKKYNVARQTIYTYKRKLTINGLLTECP